MSTNNGSGWKNKTAGDILGGAAKYNGYVALFAALLFAAVLVPRQNDNNDSVTTGGFTAAPAATVPLTPPPGASNAATAAPGVTVAAPAAAPGAPAAATPAAPSRPVGTPGNSSVATQPPPPTTIATPTGGLPPDCDPNTGRIMIPSFYAPNCVPMWPKGADNSGATWQGVTADKIVIAVYFAESNEQTDAILAAGGAGSDTTPEEDWDNRHKMLAAYQAHFETYGRTVELHKVEASGPGDDDAAARADAIRVATEIKAFASFGAPNDTDAYVEELSARGVVCLSCTVSRPNSLYEAWAPYVWSDLMSSTKGYVHRAEYVGKKLAGDLANHAGDPIMRTRERTFALVYYDTPEGSYKAGADFFEQQLAQYGVTLTDRIEVTGAHLDPAKAQTEARTVAARLADKGITSVIFAGDPLYPIFLTQEATRQAYQPEWIITGSALTDTTFFARLYDPAQWQNAFGVSFLVARVSPDVTAREFNFFEWHYGEPLTSYPSGLPMDTLFRGVHLAGPRLDPGTFRDGLFSWLPTSGFITRFGVSYGVNRWPFPDYTAADDTTEIWWDPTAQGPDELENEATGMYRYVDMGRRYLPGEWTYGAPNVFTDENTVLMYEERPPQDIVPDYPRREGLRG